MLNHSAIRVSKWFFGTKGCCIRHSLYAIMLITGCTRSESPGVSVIRGVLPSLNGKMIYLAEAHKWNELLDSTVVVNDRFEFRLPHDSAFVPFMVSLEYRTEASQTGLAALVFQNEFHTLKAGETPASHREASFYLEEGLVTITEDEQQHSNKYPSIYASVKAGRQTKVMYSLRGKEPGWVKSDDQAKRQRALGYFQNVISKHPYSYLLFDKLYDNRDQYSEQEIKQFVSLFDKQLQTSPKGDQFRNYLALRLDEGHRFPPLPATDSANKVAFMLDSTAKVNMLVFWASWCGPCRKEIPELKRLNISFRKRGLKVVSISIDEKKAAWLRAMAQENMPWSQFLVDSTQIQHVRDQLIIPAIPLVLMVDSDGQILKRYNGNYDNAYETYAAYLETVLDME